MLSNRSSDWIEGRTFIPDLLQHAPQVRPVLDRYGLRGCGGPLGPAESVEFFAKAHDVPLASLLRELREASHTPTPLPLIETPTFADTIYRPFFKAGIAVTLTLGAVWGAYLLLRIAFTGSFTGASLHEVNPHGHAQIFGWVGLFVMGFAYQAFPRFKHTTLAHPRLAGASLYLMVAGLLARSLLEPLAAPHSWTATAAVAGSLLEIVAVVLFVGVIAATWRASGKPLAFYDYYILSSLFWFVVQAVYESAYLTATLGTADRAELLGLVATWQGALRDIQVHGFALLMILGVSQRIFDHFYGFPPPSRRLSLIALVLLNGAVVGEAAGLILHRLAAGPWVGLWYAAVLVLSATVVALVVNWRLFTPVAEPDRTLKFLRAAYAWLLVSLAMLVLVPVYQRALLPWLAPDSDAARLGFSHAYHGAIRHAVTVGFISLMIVGVAARVVPTLNGLDARSLSGLWAPFLLLNGGCALRVVGQILTDFTATAFLVAGVSGLLEVTGLVLWGAHLWRIMSGRMPRAGADKPTSYLPLLPDAPIEALHRVGEVVDLYPTLLDTFVSFGFRPLANALFRRTVADRVTIERACRFMGVNVTELLEALNAARVRQGAGRSPLLLVPANPETPG